MQIIVCIEIIELNNIAMLHIDTSYYVYIILHNVYISGRSDWWVYLYSLASIVIDMKSRFDIQLSKVLIILMQSVSCSR